MKQLDTQRKPEKMTTAEEIEQELFLRYHNTRDLMTRDILVCSYLPLVHSVAKRFAGLGESQNDVIQEGSIGLLTAVDHFDASHGVKFCTYATHVITSQIQHYLRDRGRLIHQPAWVQELNTKVTRAIKQLTAKLGREPKSVEIAQELNLTEESICEVLAAKRLHHIVSLTAPSDYRDDDELLIIDSSKIHTTRYATLRLPIEDRIVVEEAINKLKILEKKVIQLFFFGDFNQSEIAHRLGISTNYTSYLLHRSLGKLKIDLMAQQAAESLALQGNLPEPPELAREMPIYDALTGLYSAGYFRARLTEEIQRLQQLPGIFSLLILTITNLPDQIERQEKFIAEVGQKITKNIRRFDLVAHFGQGCFVIHLPQSRNEAKVFADRLCLNLTKRKWLQADSDTPTFQINIAVYPDDGMSLDDLLQDIKDSELVGNVTII